MQPLIVWVPVVLVTAIVPGLLLLMPRLARSGLLFGVYVGEQGSVTEAARRITRSWYRRMAWWLVTSLAAGLMAGLSFDPLAGCPTALLIVGAGYFFEYLRAHRAARALSSGETPPAAAWIGAEAPKTWPLPLVAIGLGLAGGLGVIGYAWRHYGDLPVMVPAHFSVSGLPDHWARRSFFTVMLLPLLNLILGAGLGGLAILTGRAKRTVRHPGGRESFQAQQHFRAAMSRLLAVVAMFVTAVLSSMSLATIRVGLGEARAIPFAILALPILLIIVTLGGILYIALRYGQGGSRLEVPAADAPLTDGLADNRRWLWGLIYVNREDPSILVEHRFGLGYTINFGNWRAVALFLGFVGAVLAIVIAAIVVAGQSTPAA